MRAKRPVHYKPVGMSTAGFCLSYKAASMSKREWTDRYEGMMDDPTTTDVQKVTCLACLRAILKTTQRKLTH